MAVENVVSRVRRTGGLMSLFRTRRENIQDELAYLNRAGYEVTFILEDRWRFLQSLGSLVVLLVTLFIYTMSPGISDIGCQADLAAPKCSRGRLRFRSAQRTDGFQNGSALCLLCAWQYQMMAETIQ